VLASVKRWNLVQPNLEMKPQPKQRLGNIPLDIRLPYRPLLQKKPHKLPFSYQTPSLKTTAANVDDSFITKRNFNVQTIG